MYCPKCGGEIQNGAVFCTFCGARTEPQQNDSQQNYPPQQNYPQQNYPQQNYPQENYPRQNFYQAPPYGDNSFTPARNYQPPELAPETQKAAASKATAAMIMGIISIAAGFLNIIIGWLTTLLFVFVFFSAGVTLGILAIVFGKKAHSVLNKKHYHFWTALAGIITGAIGLGLSALWFIIIIALAAAAL